LNVCTPVTGRRPKIVLGDGVKTNFGLRVSAAHSIVLEENVICGPNVYIADTDHEYRRVGLAVLHQGITRTDGSVRIGAGSWLGASCVIAGQVSIGKGCVIGANSVVTRDVPDYSVAVGSPARVVKMYDPDLRDWKRVRGAADIEDVLRRRRERPLLSVAIPAHNQASPLRVCLEALLPQTGTEGLIEVFVADCASTDDTPRMLAPLAVRYPQLRVQRLPAASGSSVGLPALAELARGKFLLPLGAFERFLPEAAQSLLYALTTMDDCAVVCFSGDRDDAEIGAGTGLGEFRREAFPLQGRPAALIYDRPALLAKLAASDAASGGGNEPADWASRLLADRPAFGFVRGRMLDAGRPGERGGASAAPPLG
jgi:carbonic anhydrase/acetyltransferase-like protein (isoleucine patch superfamily)